MDSASVERAKLIFGGSFVPGLADRPGYVLILAWVPTEILEKASS
jgi:hypothetical protein